MIGKITPLVALSLLLTLALGSYYLAGDISEAKADIESLIETGKLTDANKLIEQLKTDYAQDEALPGTLYRIALRYESNNRNQSANQEAENIFREIIQNYPDNEYAAKSKIGLRRIEPLALIDSGRYAQAQNMLEKVLIDLAGDHGLPNMLYWAGRKFGWAEKFEQEKKAYEIIIQDYPKSEYAEKAVIGFARTQVQALIASRKFDQAENELNNLVIDFVNHPDLSNALYWIAERYSWVQKYEKAKSIYQQVVNDYPDTLYAEKASLGISKMNVILHIISHEYPTAKQRVDKLIEDFKGHPDLPETLYRLARGFEWENHFDEAKAIHKKILQQNPDSEYLSKAKLGIERANACSLILEEDKESAQAAVDKIKTDFAQHPDLPNTLYKIAQRYEWSNDYEQACQSYKQLVYEPAVVNYIMLDIARMKLCSLISSEQIQDARLALEDMILNFKDCPMLPVTVLSIGEECVEIAKEYELNNDNEKAYQYYKEAVKTWERLISELPNTEITAKAYHLAAVYSYKLEQFDKTLEYCLAIISNWSDYPYMGHIKYLIERCQSKIGGNCGGIN